MSTYPRRDGWIDAASMWLRKTYWADRMSESALKRSKIRTNDTRDVWLLAQAMEHFVSANPEATILTAADVIPYLRGLPGDDLERINKVLCEQTDTVKTGFRYFDHWHSYTDLYEDDRKELKARIKANTEIKE